MKIAYLISAYKDPAHLSRLIKALSFNVELNVVFFIHVDAKVDIKPFIKCCKANNVVFTEKRFWVQWGGYSQVMYQKELLLSAFTYEKKGSFDRFVFITAQDYPLISNKTMMDYYLANPHKQILKGIDKTKYHKESYSNFTLYHFFRDTKFRSPRIKQLFSFGSRLLFRILPFRKKPYLVIGKEKWDIWQGSSYMSLTNDCACFVYEQMISNKKLCNYFKYSFVPEEMLIPTIIFNSRFKSEAMVSEFTEYKGLIALSALEEFYYGKSIKIYTECDYNHLINSGKFFCRKVETNTGGKLMDMLDEHNGMKY